MTKFGLVVLVTSGFLFASNVSQVDGINATIFHRGTTPYGAALEIFYNNDQSKTSNYIFNEGNTTIEIEGTSINITRIVPHALCGNGTSRSYIGPAIIVNSTRYLCFEITGRCESSNAAPTVCP